MDTTNKDMNIYILRQQITRSALTIFLALLLSTSLLAVNNTSYAQSITETTGIDFGVFALTNNAAVHTYSFTWEEVITADPEFIIITNPTRGEYAITGFPPLSPLSVSVTPASLTKNGLGAGEAFNITGYDNNAVVTSLAGAATLFLGADMDTSGSGTMYDDANHSDQMTVTVSFP